MRCLLLSGLCLIVAFSLVARPCAAQADAGFGPVVLRARVVDRFDRPAPGVRVRLTADLDGVARVDGDTRVLSGRMTLDAVTDGAGVAIAALPAPRDADPQAWFCGWAGVRAALADSAADAAPLDPSARAVRLKLPLDADDFTARQALETLTLRVFERPAQVIAGAPVWPDSAGRVDRVVVVLEGFDPYGILHPGTLMRLMGPLGDALRGAGVAVMVVYFPEAGLSPDAQAPAAARAIRAAAAASGHAVAVVGVSEGALIARWALVTAENAGAPLPVNTYLSLDAPNRGANMNPALQAMVARYGKAQDRAAVLSPAALAMMACRPKNVSWKRLGLPGADRCVPVSWEEDSTCCSAFLARLRGLNAWNGYPRSCRLVGVADGCRVGACGGGDLLHLWLPGACAWTLRSAPPDRAPGSVLPAFYVSRFVTQMPLGIAGAYLRSAPTFIPTASALDAAPGEAPPFDAWYARPDGCAPLAHDRFDPEEGRFIVRQLLQSDWRKGPGPQTGADATKPAVAG